MKILDFSLAKIIPAGIETTRDNRVKGTFPYMAPEHLRKVPPNPQFDVFAVGVTLWQMLTGRRPFDDCADNAMARVQRHLAGGLESVVTAAGLPACCDEVIRGATATDPRARYPNMWPLAQALIALRARLAADPAVRLEPWERRRPIAGHAQGRRQYRAQLSPPRDSPVPHLTARKIVRLAGGGSAAAARADRANGGVPGGPGCRGDGRSDGPRPSAGAAAPAVGGARRRRGGGAARGRHLGRAHLGGEGVSSFRARRSAGLPPSGAGPAALIRKSTGAARLGCGIRPARRDSGSTGSATVPPRSPAMTEPTSDRIEALLRVEIDRAVAPYEGKAPPFVIAKLRELAERYWREHYQASRVLEILARSERVRSGSEPTGEPPCEVPVAASEKE